ncbi:hypothetical protein ACXYTJ_07950 [Gilvimarinus sp. F26214L]|uniref:hypothetical protein n=1 Tax=Gilvimarinus sp. DZF01 TaxID=3461371 RepID=UPI0040463BC3
MTDTNYNQTAPTGTAPAGGWGPARLRHVSWSSIFLGLVIAVAFQIMLGLLGLGLGFTAVDPQQPTPGSVGAWSIGSAIYIILVNIIALFIGAYIASRLAPALTKQSAIFHGMSIWALATIVMLWLGTTTVGLAISGMSSAVSGIASAAGQAVQTVVPEDLNLGSIDYQDLPQPLRQTLEENDITPEDLQQEVTGAFRQAVSRQEQQQLMQELRQTVQEVMRSPGQAGEQIGQAVDEMFGPGGILNEQDMNQLRSTLAQRLNLSEQEVQQITDQVQQGIQEAGENIKQTVEGAQQQAAETAKAVGDQVGKIAWGLFFANLLGLIAAVIGGKMGEVKTPLERH